MTVRLLVDDSRCIGAGHCARLAPDVFDQDQDTGTVVLTGDLTDADGAADAAVGLCPSGAIRWSDHL
jgi:ferredoxin